MVTLSAVAAWAGLVPVSSQGQASVSVSLDTTVELAGSTFEDQEVVTDDQLGTVTLAPLGVLPHSVDVSAYHVLPNGDQLYSLDTTAELGGGLIASPADVIRYDGATDTLRFDASAEGIPGGVVVDAVSVHGSGDLVLSFDTTVDLGAVTADDVDVVRFDGASFSLLFDGSTAGVAQGLDVDGVEVRPGGALLWMSFDGSGILGGVNFDDEDILEFDPSGPTWSLVYDGSALHAGLVAADVVAVVPEPRVGLQFAAAMALLAVLHKTRRRRDRMPAIDRS